MLKKFWKNIIFFIILLVLTFILLFKGQDTNELISTIKNIPIIFIILGLLMKFIYCLGDAVNSKILLSEFGTKITLRSALKYAFIDLFYSAITPSSTGGQPMQIYHMKKDGIDISKSTMMTLLILCSYHIISLTFMIIGVIFNFNYLINNLNLFGIVFIIGIIISVSILVILLLLIFSKKASNMFRKIASFLLKVFKVKDYDKKMETINTEIDKYHECAEYLKKNRIVFLKVLSVTFIQVLAFYSIPYLALCALNMGGANYFKMVTLQAVLNSSVSVIPLPGSIGANELGFKVMFKPIFGDSINSAMIFTRFTGFYIYVIVGAIVSITTYIKQNKMEDIVKINKNK